MFNIQQMMKQAQKMQDQMKEVQAQMEATQFTGTAGGGAVTVTVSGKYEPMKVSISEEALGDREMLEDMVLTAMKDATGKISKAMEEKMGAVTAGLNIPGLNLPGF